MEIKEVGFLLGVLFLAGWGNINDLQLKNYTRIKMLCTVRLQTAIVKPLRTFVALAYDSHGRICDMKCDMMTIPR